MISRAVVREWIVGVGLVLELPGQEPAVRLGELDRLVDHADAALRLRRQDHLGAEKAHQPAPLDAELLGHRDHQRIALGGAHHREADAGVAAGRLDDGLAGLELTRLLGRLDDAQREAVLDRAQRVEGLDLHEEVHARRRQPVDRARPACCRRSPGCCRICVPCSSPSKSAGYAGTIFKLSLERGRGDHKQYPDQCAALATSTGDEILDVPRGTALQAANVYVLAPTFLLWSLRCLSYSSSDLSSTCSSSPCCRATAWSGWRWR